MTSQGKRSIARFVGALGLGGLLAGTPATVALAGEPTTAAEARALAQEYRDRADDFRALGGVGYKAGLVRDAETEAARYDARAAELAPEPASETPAATPPCVPMKPSVQQYDCPQ